MEGKQEGEKEKGREGRRKGGRQADRFGDQSPHPLAQYTLHTVPFAASDPHPHQGSSIGVGGPLPLPQLYKDQAISHSSFPLTVHPEGNSGWRKAGKVLCFGYWP